MTADLSDGAPVDETAGPERRCIASGVSGPKEGLVRFVADPAGRVVPDLAENLPGRGMWVTASRQAIEAAVAKKAFSRAARGRLEAPADLADLVEGLLVRRCKEALGLARKSGRLTAGFEKVRAAVKKGRVGVLVAAADGAADGRKKLRGLASGATVVEVLTAAELGAALGRDEAVHLLLSPGKLADRFVRDAARLAGFRGTPAEER